MTDRELLELAAKAAGIDFRMEYDEWWDPLANDGDAFRLAVKLRMDLRIHTLPHAVYVYAGNGYAPSAIEMLEHTNAETVDANSATRRAIVRAAATIGAQYE